MAKKDRIRDLGTDDFASLFLGTGREPDAGVNADAGAGTDKKGDLIPKATAKSFADMLAASLDAGKVPDKDAVPADGDERKDAIRALLTSDPQRTIDLHEYTVATAVEEATRFLSETGTAGMRVVEIITGRGRHSKDNKPKIKPAIEALLKTKKTAGVILAIQETSNGGAFKVVLARKKRA
ncbi:MAG: Smr/MutS family protein [Patescibacteria group bacterium]